MTQYVCNHTSINIRQLAVECYTLAMYQFIGTGRHILDSVVQVYVDEVVSALFLLSTVFQTWAL